MPPWHRVTRVFIPAGRAYHLVLKDEFGAIAKGDVSPR